MNAIFPHDVISVKWKVFVMRGSETSQCTAESCISSASVCHFGLTHSVPSACCALSTGKLCEIAVFDSKAEMA